MYGDKIIARTISETKIESADGKTWQYHSRSDSHSKVACWAIMFDLLNSCELLKQHILKNKIGFGINYKMHDWQLQRPKALDLVICTPQNGEIKGRYFSDLIDKYKIVLTDEELLVLEKLPKLQEAKVSTCLMALEAKACMTEHVKALPRLYDELTSSHNTVHGDTKNAISVGFVMINSSETFISSDRNKGIRDSESLIISEHSQPYATKRVYEKVEQLKRRVKDEDAGFDAIGIVFVDCKNDGSEVHVDSKIANQIQFDDHYSYSRMIERISMLYTTAFGHL